MLSSRKSPLFALLATAIPMALGSAPDAGIRLFGRGFKKAPKRYPEQSSRQAMRRYRRARGGPGIELVDGVYFVKLGAE